MTPQRTGPGTIVGSLRAVDGKAVVRIEDAFGTDAEDLWSTLTDPQRLARWVARVDGDLRLGGGFRARFTSGWEGAGRVDVCEPPRRLLVTMSPGQDDQTVIEAELVPDGDQTRLVLEEAGFPCTRLPRTAPDGRRTSRISPRTWRVIRPRTGRPDGPS